MQVVVAGEGDRALVLFNQERHRLVGVLGLGSLDLSRAACGLTLSRPALRLLVCQGVELPLGVGGPQAARASQTCRLVDALEDDGIGLSHQPAGDVRRTASSHQAHRPADAKSVTDRHEAASVRAHSAS